MINKKELLDYLKILSDSNDTESAHASADAALIEFINDKEIKKAYGHIKKWYA